MKALSTADSPQRKMRRISKPVMEKRRRERINHSLETLRLLMLENTDDEKLKNPKVEKAEILESVVQFLKSEKDIHRDHRTMERLLSRDQGPPSARRQIYSDGMRSCLLRVSHFFTSNSQKSGETSRDAVQASIEHPDPKLYPPSSGDMPKTLLHTPGPTALSAQHLPLHPRASCFSHAYHSQTSLHCDTAKLLLSPAACTNSTDPVWRPWPQ